MLQQLLQRSRAWRRWKMSNAAQIRARMDLVEDGFCEIVSDLALISRNEETRIIMPIVQVAAEGRLSRRPAKRPSAETH